MSQLAMPMSKSFLCFIFLVLQTLSYSTTTSAIKYVVVNDAINTTGGRRFQKEIGVTYTKQIMQTINYFIWDIFQQYNSSDRNPVETVTVFIQEYDGAEAITCGNHVNVSSLYLKGYEGNLKWEFTSLLHHELTHVFQWFAEGVPINLIEGIADYMILKSNYYPAGYAKPGQGERWDQGYDFTARFLEYCEELRSGFVAELNRMMRSNKYSDDFFVKLMGKPVDQLWSEYKAKYGNGQI